jgi:hypothetical protein
VDCDNVEFNGRRCRDEGCTSIIYSGSESGSHSSPQALASPYRRIIQNRAELILSSSEPVILTGAKDTNLLLGELDAADYA